MKTIKQWLNECDKEELIETFLQRYFDAVSDIPEEYHSLQIVELVERMKQNVADCIEHLISLDAPESSDDKIGIIFGHNHYGEEENAELVYADELLKNGPESCSTYAYEFTPQAQMVGYYIGENAHTKRHQYAIMAAWLYEATWFGWTQQRLPEAHANLEAAIEEMQRGNTAPIDLEDFFHDDYRENVEEEKEKNQIEKEIYTFATMCKRNALAEILKILQEQEEYIDAENSFK